MHGVSRSMRVQTEGYDESGARAGGGGCGNGGGGASPASSDERIVFGPVNDLLRHAGSRCNALE